MTPTPVLTTARAKAPATVLALAVVVSLAAGCSDDGDAARPGTTDPSTSAAPSPATADEQLATTTTLRTVTGGRLSRAERGAVRDRVTAVVDDWFERAYLGGDYPRTDFTDAFDAFTPGARARAVDDRKLMSNAAVGTTTYAVRALARRAVVDVLAVAGRADAATVQFRLGMARAGESGAERRERVSGHLFLTFRKGDGWQVFGYDVQRGDLA
ncbi:hypothetical protein [Nocardioides rubriscoriae]|uniref:hypothetical protein n=1 Tax=Nocardioides rubriscoriae TaxID=642762 RepID=UPI0011DFC67F|nr:hypothetical protein [Nocardioides rubriscoriae]